MVLTEGLKWRMLQCRMAGVEIWRQRSTKLVGEVVAGRLRASDPHEQVLLRDAKPGRWSARLGGHRRRGNSTAEWRPGRRRRGGTGKDGGAPVRGLAGSSSKAAGAWRRRSSGGARGWWGTSTVLGDGGRAGGAMGAGETTAARRRLRTVPKCWRKAEEEGTYIGPPFCPGSWLHPGQKVFLGGPRKFPARGPPLVPGGSTTRDKRGSFSLISTKSYVCFCFFLILF